MLLVMPMIGVYDVAEFAQLMLDMDRFDFGFVKMGAWFLSHKHDEATEHSTKAQLLPFK